MQWQMYVAPLGRTPMDKKSATSMSRYFNRLREFVTSITPGGKGGDDKWERIARRAKDIEAKLGDGK